MGTSKILASAATSASYNMMFQLMFRLMTFVLNAYILRHVSKEFLGVVNVRLILLYTTILMIVREAFRRACLSKTQDRKWQQVINLLWCILPISVFVASFFAYIWYYILEKPDPDLVPNYGIAVICFAVSTVIENLAEPLWVISQAFLFVRLRAIVDGICLALRVLLTAVAVTYFPHWGLFGACCAHIISTVVYPVIYYGYFIYYLSTHQKEIETDKFPLRSWKDFLPKQTNGQPLFNAGLVKLTWSFFKQTVLKQLLTEGERYAMTIFNILSFSDQGMYDVVNNLGSLVARFVFFPIEDSGFLFFTQSFTRGVPIKDQNKESVTLACRVLESLLTLVVLIGVTFLAFGYPYSYLLLDIYGGENLSSGSGPTLLRWYCVYVLIIAVNGVTECFVFAAMSQKEVDKYNHKMLLFSIIFLLSSYYLGKHLGGVGFILANCLNIAARVAHSVYYIHHFTKDSDHYPLRGMFPSMPVMICYIGSFLITFYSERFFCCDSGWVTRLVHIGVGGVCLLVVLGAIFLTQKRLLTFVVEQYKEKIMHTKAE
ncbi:protein RFT1 homolog isoform X2 [Lineus longissimus]